MERVLDAYKRPYDPLVPVICVDESPRRLIGETRIPLRGARGRTRRCDYQYDRRGVCTVFSAMEPLMGKQLVQIREQKTKRDWACFLRGIAEQCRHAQRIVLVMDNPGTHTPGAFCETYASAEAQDLWDRFEFVHTPKQGSWLNMAKIPRNVPSRQCQNRRIKLIDEIREETQAWEQDRSDQRTTINWEFSIFKARRKLKRHYPTYDS